MSAQKFAPSPEQSVFYDWVRDGRGSTVLEAVAGSGKTTTLVAAVRLMRGAVALMAFNTKMADELKERTSGLGNVRAGTFHSAGFGALKYAAGRSKLSVDAGKVRSIVVEWAELDQDLWPYVSAICKLTGLAKQSGFGVRSVLERPRGSDWRELADHYDVYDLIPEDGDPEVLISGARRALEASNELRLVVDFDDMIYLPLLFGLRFFQNDWVLIDEAQDTNAVRLEMARRMLKPGGRLVAVGDPHQAIYGFSGADSSSLDSIRRKFGATTMSLSVSWRCPRAVVDEARKHVAHIRASDAAPLGEVREADYADVLKALEPGDAVLCRYNRQLVSTCFRLIREGRPAKIEGRAIGEGLLALCSRWKVKRLDALEQRLEAHFGRELVKAREKEDEAKEERVLDTQETLRVLIERAREQGGTTIEQLRDLVRSMFDDVGASSRLIVLSSVHRSKGLEWPRVHVLGMSQLMPSKRARQDWQREQEVNLLYVAITRSQSVLVDVTLPTELL